MVWFVAPIQLKDEQGNPSGKWRLIARSDDGGGFHECTQKTFDSPEAAANDPDSIKEANLITGMPDLAESDKLQKRQQRAVLTLKPINQNWTDENGFHQGGVSTGIGYTIAWQRGPLNEAGRNGAFLIEVLESCKEQLDYYQNSQFSCQENQTALEFLESAIQALQSRRDRRQNEGNLGTHNV